MGEDTATTGGAAGGRRPSTFVISITPFDREGRLDETALRAHLRRMGAAGIGVYVGGGGSGEGFTLSAAEMRTVLDVAAEELGGKVPVRAMGTEPHSAREMIEFVAVARRSGIDAAQIYSLDIGHGHQPVAREIETYLTDVLESSELPVVLSTHQSVGYRIPIDLIAGLVHRFDHVIGVNCSHADLSYLAQLVDAVGERVDVHVGGPAQTLSALSLGAHGFLSSEGNLAPQLCTSVLQRYTAGDLAGVFDRFGRLLRLHGSFLASGGIRATKAYLHQRGLPGGFPRKPQLPVSADTLAQITRVVDDLGIPGIEGW